MLVPDGGSSCALGPFGLLGPGPSAGLGISDVPADLPKARLIADGDDHQDENCDSFHG
jgi:hypothetical protein